ncbi:MULTISPECIES: tRNA pseudouridine(55) synthase TruB [unclassified Leifsonia]|uniref:tRNA pseudouridine(55) synthase TruB n=1 Tax=unclassified Leifsonia TaxID=2663824 RepID=UPI0008A738B5|nr:MULTISPECIES: tRNA pseudouridine(55) synthase TruB [unclassified Leifsonia]SEH73620.1 tRNA pseudouridine synthase B [Leifsonia sp. CL154]SFL35103.1 tRNA pseudouridine synthase B [Leifsonia sp. CL147]
MTGSGLILIDKPAGITSHDVVARVRKAAGTRKVGHAGTLDPMATGLLILGINSSTRLLTYIVGADKEYLATIRLGAASTTDDAEGELLAPASQEALDAVTAEAIVAGIAELTGEIEQVPSSVSAIKVDGKRAYARVRAGEQVELKARAVTISEFELLGTRREPGAIDLEVRVVCSSGTYIRSLARDLGAGLGVGAGVGGHLTALRRTRVGAYDVRDAHDLATLDAEAALIPAVDAAGRLFETLELTEQQAIDLTHGRRIHLADREGPGGEPVAAIAPTGALVGLIEFRGKEARTLVNFPTDEAVGQAGGRG